MTREDIIRMARESQQESFANGTGYWFKMELKDLERFAALVAAEAKREASFDKAELWLERLHKEIANEREMCAKLADEAADMAGDPYCCALECRGIAESIRARSQA